MRWSRRRKREEREVQRPAPAEAWQRLRGRVRGDDQFVDPATLPTEQERRDMLHQIRKLNRWAMKHPPGPARERKTRRVTPFLYGLVYADRVLALSARERARLRESDVMKLREVSPDDLQSKVKELRGA